MNDRQFIADIRDQCIAHLAAGSPEPDPGDAATPEPEPTPTEPVVEPTPAEPEPVITATTYDQYDVRYWGAEIGFDTDASKNTNAIRAALVAGQPLLTFTGPVLINDTLQIEGVPCSFVGTNPWHDNAGGLIMDGSKTLLETINVSGVQLERMRFYGCKNPAQLAPYGVRIIFDHQSPLWLANDPRKSHNTRTVIRDCVFRARNALQTHTWETGVETNARNGSPGGADMLEMTNTALVGCKNVGVDILNSQSTGWKISHCMIDVRSGAYSEFTGIAINTKADGIIEQCFVNRAKEALNVSQANVVTCDYVDVEHCRTLLRCNNNGAMVTLSGGRMNCHADSIASANDYLIVARCRRLIIDDVDFRWHYNVPKHRMLLGGGPTPSYCRVACDKLDLDQVQGRTAKRNLFDNPNGTKFVFDNNVDYKSAFIPAGQTAIP